MKLLIFSIIGFLWIGCNKAPTVQDDAIKPSNTPLQGEVKPTDTPSDKKSVKPLLKLGESKAIKNNFNELTVVNDDDANGAIDTTEQLDEQPTDEGELASLKDTEEQDIPDVDSTGEGSAGDNLAEVDLPRAEDVDGANVDDQDQSIITIPSFVDPKGDSIDQAVGDSVDKLVKGIIHPKATDDISTEDARVANDDEALPTSEVLATETDSNPIDVTDQTSSQDLAYVDHTPTPLIPDESVGMLNPQGENDTLVHRNTITRKEEDKWWIEKALDSMAETGEAFLDTVIEWWGDDDEFSRDYVIEEPAVENQNNLSRPDEGVTNNIQLASPEWAQSWLTGNRNNENYFLFQDDLQAGAFAGWYQLVSDQISAFMIVKVKDQHVPTLLHQGVTPLDLIETGAHTMFRNWGRKHVLCHSPIGFRDTFKGVLAIFKSDSNNSLVYGDYVLNTDNFKLGYVEVTDKRSGEYIVLDQIDSKPLDSLENKMPVFSNYFRNYILELIEQNPSPCDS